MAASSFPCVIRNVARARCASKLSGLALTASERRRSTAGRSGEMLLCAAASAGANERKPRATTVVINFFPLALRPPASARRHVSASDGGPVRSLVHLRAKRYGETSPKLEERRRGEGGPSRPHLHDPPHLPLKVNLSSYLNLPRRITHAGDAGEIFRVEEIQRAGQVERRRVGHVEHFATDLEPALAPDPELFGDAQIQLSQRRPGHLAAFAAERAEVGLADRGDRRRIR